MTTFTWTTGSTSIRGVNPQGDFDFYTENTAIPAGGSSVTEQDVVSNVSDTDNNFRVVIQGSVPATLVNLSPTVCTLDADGTARRLTDGTAIIDISTSVGRRRLVRDVSHGSTSVFSGFASGSLAAHVAASVDAMISGKVASEETQKRLLSDNGNLSAPNIVSNPNLFCAALNLSAISMYTEQGAWGRFPAVLISPRHFIIASHVAGVADVGNSIVWKASSGAYETVTVSMLNGIGNDIHIGYLSRSIETISPLKFLPANWKSYLPCLSSLTNSIGPGGPASVALPLIAKTWTVDANRPWGNGFKLISVGQAAIPVSRSDWTMQLAIGGDSSGPILAPINGNTVLLAHWHSSSGGPMYAAYLSAIEQMMNAAKSGSDSTTYSLTKVDLSGFTEF